MAQDGMSYDAALAEAQRRGYAEADPSNDVDGVDAAYKLAILASLAFHTTVHPDDVYREGITGLSPRDFRFAADLGYVIRLLATAGRVDGQLDVRVHPALLSLRDPLARVDGVLNAVAVEGDLLGRAILEGGRRPAPSPPPVPSSPTCSTSSPAASPAAAPGRRVWPTPVPPIPAPASWLGATCACGTI